MKMKKKIVFFSHESKLYGAPRSMLILVDALKEKYDVEIMAYGEGDLVEESSKKKIPIKVLDKSYLALKNKEDKSLLVRAVLKLCRYFDAIRIPILLIKRRPDLVYVNTIANHWPVVIAHLLKIRCIVHVRESESYIFPTDTRREKRANVIFKKAKNFICVSESIKELVIKRLQDDEIADANVTRVYNGIDYRSFCGDDIEELEVNLPSDKKIVGFLGNINPRKGLHIFFQAATVLLKKRKDIAFLVVGGDNQKFEDLLKKENINVEDRESIFHIPFIKKPQSVFKKFDIYCMTSLSEPFARVNLEAACMKVPVIASAIHGNKEVFENKKNGILIEPGNSAQLAEEIENLLSNPYLAEELASNAYNTVKEKFTVERYINGCEKIIEKVINK